MGILNSIVKIRLTSDNLKIALITHHTTPTKQHTAKSGHDRVDILFIFHSMQLQYDVQVTR